MGRVCYNKAASFCWARVRSIAVFPGKQSGWKGAVAADGKGTPFLRMGPLLLRGCGPYPCSTKPPAQAGGFWYIQRFFQSMSSQGYRMPIWARRWSICSIMWMVSAWGMEGHSSRPFWMHSTVSRTSYS